MRSVDDGRGADGSNPGRFTHGCQPVAGAQTVGRLGCGLATGRVTRAPLSGKRGFCANLCLGRNCRPYKSIYGVTIDGGLKRRSSIHTDILVVARRRTEPTPRLTLSS